MTAEEKPKQYHSKIREDGCITFYTNQCDSFEGKNILVENVITTECAKEIRDNLNKCLGVNVAKDMLEYSESVRNGVQQELDHLRKENEGLKENLANSECAFIELMKAYSDLLDSINTGNLISVGQSDMLIDMHSLVNRTDYFKSLQHHAEEMARAIENTLKEHDNGMSAYKTDQMLKQALTNFREHGQVK